jgi:hypothetical protein
MNIQELKLGSKQRNVLDALREHGSWDDSDGGGWVWDSRPGTKRVMDILVKKGLARVSPDGKWLGQVINVYYPT